MANYKIYKFPKSRIASVDVCEIGRRMHHVSAFLEADVTRSREKVKKYKKETGNISFTAWLVKTIAHTIAQNKSVAGYLKGKRKVILFDDVNVSFAVEKEINGQRVPLPFLIKKANDIGIESITEQISNSKNSLVTEKDIVLQQNSTRAERLYYHMPGPVRRFFWTFLLKHPDIAFDKMGNVAITSLGMTGRINGWFIPISVHPVCFGLGPVIKKPVVMDDKIEIREIMNISVLLDHDVIDGAPMARFIKELLKNIENGMFL